MEAFTGQEQNCTGLEIVRNDQIFSYLMVLDETLARRERLTEVGGLSPRKTSHNRLLGL